MVPQIKVQKMIQILEVHRPPKMIRMAKEVATKSPPVAAIDFEMSLHLRSIAIVSDLEQFFTQVLIVMERWAYFQI